MAKDLATLAPLLAEDPDAAGEKYGEREGTSPFSYAVKATGQVEYADAATALNRQMAADVLQDLDPATIAGKKVTVVGATAPLDPTLLTLTPVSIEVAP